MMDDGRAGAVCDCFAHIINSAVPLNSAAEQTAGKTGMCVNSNIFIEYLKFPPHT